ncbi:MFS transporter [Sulfobacillus harzensis]|uniref:MFS transporter n=1 Tax=Sulfobacillus harzensis TaxID=2729629 RepID=A0A7Y0L3H5_9FIRM|nr:MFS transporter [Sulfobacillus harzensis]NMP21720.1 MFS transporter [Sulfobacillus harzensis]
MAVQLQKAHASSSLRQVIGWLSWTHFLNDGIANYLPGILPFILSQRHVPAALAGGFMTALLLAQGLQPLSGWIADRIGGRVMVLGGVALSTASAALVGWAHPVWLLILLLILTGIGNTAFHPQALSITRGHVGSRQGAVMSVFLVGGEIGRSLGPLAAGVVVHQWGLNWIWLLALPLLITYPWVMKVIPPAPKKSRQGAPIAFNRHIKPASALLGYSLVRSATTYEMVTLSPILWHQRGGSLVVGSALVTVLIGVGIVGNLLGGAMNDRFGKGAVLAGTSILAIISLAGFASLSGFWIWPALGVMGIALFGSSSTTMLIGQDIFSENPALGSGVALGLANGLGAILVIPLTYLAAEWGDATIVWILAALTLATMPTIWGMPRGRKELAAHHA